MKKVGRPNKYTTEELKKIVNSYIDYHKGRKKPNATQIAEYANEILGLTDLKYYTFNRDLEVKKYILEIKKNVKQKQQQYNFSIADTAFVSMNVEKYSELPKDRLILALENINQYICKIIDSNTLLYNENLKLKNKISNYQLKELSKEKNLEDKEVLYKAEKEVLNQNIKSLKQELAAIKSQKSNLETAIEVLWEQEATAMLKKLGIICIEEEYAETNLFIDSVREDIHKLENQLNQIGKTEEDEKVVELNFKKKIRDL